MTGKGMTQTWLADTLFPFAEKFYREAEALTNQQFFHPMPVYRPFLDAREQNEWSIRSGSHTQFIQHIHTTPSFAQAHDPWGGIVTSSSGYVAMPRFLGAVADWLKKNDSYTEGDVDVNALEISERQISYKNLTASSIIFCEGHAARHNPYFSWLPIHPLKGETLRVEVDEKLEAIYNRGVYIVPTEQENLYTVGATYKPNDEQPGVTAEGRAELEKKLTALLRIPFSITDQNWGIRPAVPNRRPILGSHPVHKNVLILNGMGTKGVTLAPYMASLMANWLEGAAELPQEVNIERFKSLYSKFGFLPRL